MGDEDVFPSTQTENSRAFEPQVPIPLSSQLGPISGFLTWDIILSDSHTYGTHALLLSCCFLGSPDLHENASQSWAFRQSLSTSHLFQV